MLRSCAVSALLLLSAAVPLSALQVKGTPVQKVIEMMNEMLVKGNAEKEAEAKIFAEYAEWVDDTSQETGFAIKTLNADIEKLTATAEKADSDTAELSESIGELDGEISTWEADQKAATGLRESQNAEYMKISTDYSESLDALDAAINVLSKQDYARGQAEMLLQQMATKSSGMQRVLAAFLQQKAQGADAGGNGAPAVAAYEASGGGIITMLEKLKKKFKTELDTVQTEEANTRHAYDLEMLHLGNSIEAASGDRSKKIETRAQSMADSAEAKGALANAQTDLADSQKTLQDVKSTFLAKTGDFKANQQVRAEEIEAITKAVEIISGAAVSGGADKHLPGLVQKSEKAPSLLQVRRSSKRVTVRARAAEFLRKRADALGSKVLSLAAIQLGTNFDPFAKVIKMIETLITRLEEEAAAEAGHKAWCDGELKENKLTRDEKTSEVALLTAAAEKLAGEIAAFAKELEELAAAQAALAKAMKEATEFREKEKAENLQTIDDAKKAQEAVSSALTILKEFYAKQAGLIQVAQVPEMKAYKGQGGASTGVVGMLEVILSDFARLEAETTADEGQSATEYDQFMTDSKTSSKAKHDEEFDKGLLKDKKEHELKGTNKDLRSTQQELDASLLYYAELKPQCLEVKVSYEERVARRKDEIEALKQAYTMLGGQ